METRVLVALLVFVLMAAACWLISTARGFKGRTATWRLRRYSPRPEARGDQSDISLVRGTAPSRVPWLEFLLMRLDVADRLSRELQRAAVPLRAGEFFFFQLAVGVIGALVARSALRDLFDGLAPAAAVGLLLLVAPLLWLRMKQRRRTAAFERDLPDALAMVATSMRVGYGLTHGLELVVREVTGPCAEEFGQVLQEINLGADLDVALARLVDRVASEDARLLTIAVAIHRRTGGNLAEVLESMSSTIRERMHVRNEVSVITTAPRVSGYVVSGLPVLTGIVMYLTSPYYMEILFVHDLGRMLLVVATVLVVVGLYLNNRIAQVEL